VPTPITQQQLQYICRQMLHVDWSPKLSEQALNILSRCDSRLEQMFILGALHYIERTGRHADGPDVLTIRTSDVKFNDEKYVGLWVQEPWFGWYREGRVWGGPSALLMVPQLRSPSKDIRHDFGLFYGDDNGSPKWTFRHAVEVDGYAVHEARREKDELRDSDLSYSVLRFHEEQDKPLEWFRQVVLKDENG
jgi:hypothetical protein